MAKFENGIRFYTTATAIVTVHFPENEVKCAYCPWCRSENELKRFWCRINNEMIYDPFLPILPKRCPLRFEADENGVLKEDN